MNVDDFFLHRAALPSLVNLSQADAGLCAHLVRRTPSPIGIVCSNQLIRVVGIFPRKTPYLCLLSLHSVLSLKTVDIYRHQILYQNSANRAWPSTLSISLITYHM